MGFREFSGFIRVKRGFEVFRRGFIGGYGLYGFKEGLEWFTVISRWV